MTSQQHIAAARQIVEDVLTCHYGYITAEVQCAMKHLQEDLRNASDEIEREKVYERTKDHAPHNR